MDSEQAIEVQDLGSYEDNLYAFQDAVNEYLEKNYDAIKDGYHEMLRDCWRYHCDLDEVDDGRGEYVEESYTEETWIKKPVK